MEKQPQHQGSFLRLVKEANGSPPRCGVGSVHSVCSHPLKALWAEDTLNNLSQAQIRL